MLTDTLQALQNFDNLHDFERMAADILNALGYSDVEPMAPGGGSDGGRDIKFREGDTPGVAFVTLEKAIVGKFKLDLEKQPDAQGLIALFCNVTASPARKLAFTKDAVAKGYRLEVFDLERIRSLLDSRLKDIRRRYLKMNDEVASRLRSEVTKLLRFPAAAQSQTNHPTVIEGLLDQAPFRLFELLMRHEEQDIKEVPGIGPVLYAHLTAYYEFRREALRLEQELLVAIGQTVRVRLPQGWHIYLRYILLRFGGFSKEAIISGGSFLNYLITWDDAERVFIELSQKEPFNLRVPALIRMDEELSERVAALTVDAQDE
jgi:hypothetical protein